MPTVKVLLTLIIYFGIFFTNRAIFKGAFPKQSVSVKCNSISELFNGAAMPLWLISVSSEPAIAGRCICQVKLIGHNLMKSQGGIYTSKRYFIMLLLSNVLPGDKTFCEVCYHIYHIYPLLLKHLTQFHFWFLHLPSITNSTKQSMYIYLS